MKFFPQAAPFVALVFLSSIFLSQNCLAIGGSNSNVELAKQILADNDSTRSKPWR
jgi:hypothetical protein